MGSCSGSGFLDGSGSGTGFLDGSGSGSGFLDSSGSGFFNGLDRLGLGVYRLSLARFEPFIGSNALKF